MDLECREGPVSMINELDPIVCDHLSKYDRSVESRIVQYANQRDHQLIMARVQGAVIFALRAVQGRTLIIRNPARPNSPFGSTVHLTLR